MMTVALVGCVDAADDDPTITVTHGHSYAVAIDVANKLEITQDNRPGGHDLCALAAELSSDNICALICDPDAMKAELTRDGMPSGTCYEFSCVMTDGTTATVGVCLAPLN